MEPKPKHVLHFLLFFFVTCSWCSNGRHLHLNGKIRRHSLFHKQFQNEEEALLIYVSHSYNQSSFQCFHTKNSSHSMSKISEEGILRPKQWLNQWFFQFRLQIMDFPCQFTEETRFNKMLHDNIVLDCSYIFISAAQL
jgi:hypothetical protein